MLCVAELRAGAYPTRSSWPWQRAAHHAFRTERRVSDAISAGAGALIVLASVLLLSERRPLVELAAKNRLPAVYPTRDFVKDGGLMSYGALWADIYRRAAAYVDKILKGAKPADHPLSNRPSSSWSST
jgi:ABC-type uncharacterized transport system substrate-binding protein